MKPIGKRCIYHRHDTGIREFIFLEKSSGAVDEWIRHLDHIMLTDPPQGTMPEMLLLDIREHVPGAVYTARRLHAWRRTQNLDDTNTRAVVLLGKQAHMVMIIAGTIINAVGLETMRIQFVHQDRQKAIDWLLAP